MCVFIYLSIYLSIYIYIYICIYIYIIYIVSGRGVQIPLWPTFYSYFKKSFSDEYQMYHSLRFNRVITSRKFQLK